MIIFGWGNAKIKDYGAAFCSDCENCNNSVFYHFVRIRDWFDIFWIPLFPYKIEYFLMCPTCGQSIEIEDREIKICKEICELTDKFLDEELNDKEYNKNIKLLIKILGR